MINCIPRKRHTTARCGCERFASHSLEDFHQRCSNLFNLCADCGSSKYFHFFHFFFVRLYWNWFVSSSIFWAFRIFLKLNGFTYFVYTLSIEIKSHYFLRHKHLSILSIRFFLFRSLSTKFILGVVVECDMESLTKRKTSLKSEMPNDVFKKYVLERILGNSI